MTSDEYLDAMKPYYTIYRCPTCGVRGFGAAVTYHELYNKDHAAMQPEPKTIKEGS